MFPAASLDEFRKRLLSAFPPQPFHALISTHDECDDGLFLRHALRGKRWAELPTGTLFHASIALPLLSPEALVAFLPAWLLHARQNLSPSDLTLEFTVYFLCPGNPEEGWEAERLAKRVRLFTPPQRTVVADLLTAILQTETLHAWHPYAEFGLKHWEPQTRETASPPPAVQ